MRGAVWRDGEAISGGLLAALGVYILLQASAWDYSTADGPGPGFFPFWYGAAMVLLSLALAVTRLRRGGAGRAIDWSGAGRALATWGAFALSVALMAPLGFLIGFALLTFFLVTVTFRGSFAAAAASAVLTPLGFYLVFSLGLGLDLPTGVFGF